MICEECKKEGKTSKIYPGICTETQVYYQPFYDEQGRYHNHDGNRITINYACSNGHTWINITGNKCWCGWHGEWCEEEKKD